MTAERRETPRVSVMLKRLQALEERPRLPVLGAAILLVFLIGYFDSHPGWRLNFTAFYLLPLAMVVWFSGTRAGLATMLLSVAVWFVGHHLPGATPRPVFVEVWNATARLALYLVFVLTLAALRRTMHALAAALRREHELARMDGLTAVRNARAFREAAEQEVARAERYGRPLTLAYLDADGFKAVNDTLGHSAGDRVLRTIAQTLAGNVRTVDTVARLGGDEFAVLFPETGAEAAAAALRKLQDALAEAMAREQVRVTFCIGAVTAVRPVLTVDGLLQRADALMYAVKRHGKNAIRAEVLDAGAAVLRGPAGRRASKE